MCKKSTPERLVIASPVGSPELARALRQKDAVDEVVILEQPKFFRSVAQVYERWRDIPDHEVLKYIRHAKQEFVEINHKSKE